MTSTLNPRADGPEPPTPAPRRGGEVLYVCDGGLAHQAVLIDVTGREARLHLGGACLSDQIVLVDPRTGLSRLAAVIWREYAELGVRFLGEGVRYRVLRSARDLAWDRRRQAS